jgi:hypothetical protein
MAVSKEAATISRQHSALNAQVHFPKDQPVFFRSVQRHLPQRGDLPDNFPAKSSQIVAAGKTNLISIHQTHFANFFTLLKTCNQILKGLYFYKKCLQTLVLCWQKRVSKVYNIGSGLKQEEQATRAHQGAGGHRGQVPGELDHGQGQVQGSAYLHVQPGQEHHLLQIGENVINTYLPSNTYICTCDLECFFFFFHGAHASEACGKG